MPKKCIPGVICIENMTLVVLFVALIIIGYLYYNYLKTINTINKNMDSNREKIIIMSNNEPASLGPLAAMATRSDPFNDPYAPPLKVNSSGLGMYIPRDSGDIRGIPVNVKTRGFETGYQQVGILTRMTGNSDMILPLMGRQAMTGRDKWQYYTISNSGNLNTKLPISLNGKSCTSEYGCDDINNGDVVYVEGYKDTFRVTMYENNLFRYIPYL